MSRLWVGRYQGTDMYKYTKEEFCALPRRERGKIYVVNNYVVLNDNIIGVHGDGVVLKAPEGVNIYDTLGVEKPVRIEPPKPRKKRNVVVPAEPREELKVEAEEPVAIDTLVE